MTHEERPEHLRATLDVCLASPVPMAIYWGPQRIQFYNDAYRPMLDSNHPAAFGRPAHECVTGVWNEIAGAVLRVFEYGVAVCHENVMVANVSDGALQERYYTFSCSAVTGEAGVAGVLCVATDTTDSVLRQQRLVDERRTMLENIKRLADELPQAVWLADRLGALKFHNQRWHAFTGTKNGDDWLAVLHPEDRDAFLGAWQHSIVEGATFSFDYRLWHASEQRYRWVTARAASILVDGDDREWLGTTIDIDRHKREEAASQLLALASDMLNSSLDTYEILHALPAVTIGPMADFTFTYSLGEGRMRRIAWAHREPGQTPALYRVHSASAMENRPGHFMSDVSQGHTKLFPRVTDEILREFSLNEEHFHALKLLDICSMIAVPIDAGGRVIGALTFSRTSSSNPYDQHDLDVVRELARRAGIAIANADIFEREHRIALSFQDAALPNSLDSRNGVEIRAYYAPARAESQVGGDWYDSVVLPDGRILLSIGDVSGSGLHAAVVMSMVRHAIRSAAYMHADPAMILEAADMLVRAEAPDHFVTAFVAIVDPITRFLSYCSAGHPPPLLLANGSVHELTIGSNLPLGLAHATERAQFSRPLDYDSILVFYTDGLIEGLGNFNPGADALLRAAADERFSQTADPTTLHGLLLPDGGRDDVAILTARINCWIVERDLYRDERSIVTALDAVRARDDIALHLAQCGLTEDALANARLIVGEITANVARHAPGPVTIVVDPTLEDPVVHIIDSGPGFWYAPKLPRNDMAESGRGLFIASLFARRCEISPARSGGSHARLVIART